MEDEKKMLNEATENKTEELDNEQLEDAAGGRAPRGFMQKECPNCGELGYFRMRCDNCGTFIE